MTDLVDDAATGTSNTAIAAVSAGATVDACDLTPRLLDVARARSADAGVDIAFVEADLIALPYEDDAFDVVLSTFGAFTVDDPEVNDPEVPNPSDWAELDGVRGFVSGLDVEVRVEQRTIWFRFPSLAAAFELFEVASGPYLRMRAAIEDRDPHGWNRVREDVLAGWRSIVRGGPDGTVEFPGTYGIATIIPG